MARGCGKYLTPKIFGALALSMDGQNQGYFTTNGIPKNQTPIIIIEPVLLFYLPHQFMRHLMSV